MCTRVMALNPNFPRKKKMRETLLYLWSLDSGRCESGTPTFHSRGASQLLTCHISAFSLPTFWEGELVP